MKALSIQQPWAWLIIRGYKNLENRTWPTNVRGPILIHAGKKYDREGALWVRAKFPHVADIIPAQLPLGGIVGAARLTDCIDTSHPSAASPWYVGPYAFVLQEQEPFVFTPLRGHLGFFNVEWPPR